VKNELPLIPAAMKLFEEIMSPGLMDMPGDGLLEAEVAAVGNFKKVGLLVLGATMQKYGQKAVEEQEILTNIADICTDIFAAESAVLRAQAAAGRRVPGAEMQAEAARAFVNDAAARIDFAAKTALATMEEGDTLRMQLAALRRVLKVTPVNTVAIRRKLAESTVSRGGYIFS